MIFSRETILKKIEEGLITIDPFNPLHLEEASYDLTFGSSDIVVELNSFVLGKTKEKITLSPRIAALVFTTSSLARKGIDLAQSSLYCHPKTDNEITIEIVNHNNTPVSIKKGDVVAKIIFIEVV